MFECFSKVKVIVIDPFIGNIRRNLDTIITYHIDTYNNDVDAWLCMLFKYFPLRLTCNKKNIYTLSNLTSYTEGLESKKVLLLT